MEQRPDPSFSEPGAALAGEKRFQLLVDAIQDYAIYLLDPQGRVNSWNTGAERLKGYTAQEILGVHFSRFYTPEDAEAGAPMRALAAARDEGKFEAEGWRVRKDGSRFWASVHIEPVKDPHGAVIGFSKVTRDISECKKAQDEMELAREALGHAQKLEAIGRLTGGVAHDFNNFLTVIRSSVELLRRCGADEVRRERYIRAIAETADRAALLTKQLLAFSRQQPLRPQPFLARERVLGMAQMLETMAGASIQVAVECEESDEPVLADPTQFDTALLNLVVNAKDAMPEGGRLKISTRNVGAVPAIRRHAGAKGDFVAMAIEDSGSGIEPLTLGRIFEPFFTTKPANKGTGLGLSQVYGFVKQSGGEIDVRSRLGEGTCFTLYLPRAKVGVSAARPGDAPGAPEAAPTLSILLVEDNDDVGHFALGMLTEIGHSATLAVSANEALEILEAQRTRFDLVLTDVVMPGMNGVELANEIRARWPDLPVALTSGYSHALAERANDGFCLLQKPYSIQELEAVLARTVQAHRPR